MAEKKMTKVNMDEVPANPPLDATEPRNYPKAALLVSNHPVIKAIRKVRDKTANLQSDVASLNAVAPHFDKYEKSRDALLIAGEKASGAFIASAVRAETLDLQRRDLSLEKAYQALQDKARGKLNPYLSDRLIGQKIFKDEKMIRAAYDEMPSLCSMLPEEVKILRSTWVYTGVALRRAATQQYRHKQARQVLDRLVDKTLEYDAVYYLARVLNTARSTGEPRAFDIRPTSFRMLEKRFLQCRLDVDKALETVRKFQSTPRLQTIEKRDLLVKLLYHIADAFRDLEAEALQEFRWRPQLIWDPADLKEIDPYQSKHLD
jgi:hypothetical protein